MIVTVRVADKTDGERQSDEALVILGYCTVNPPINSKEAAQSLTMWHFVWGTESVQSGKRYSSQPSYGVVALRQHHAASLHLTSLCTVKCCRAKGLFAE